MPVSKRSQKRKHLGVKQPKKNPNKAYERYAKRVKKMSIEAQAENAYREALGMLQAAAQFLPLMQDQDLRNHADTTVLDTLIIAASQDIQRFKERLDLIRDEHNVANTIQDNVERRFRYLSLGEQYMQFVTEFNTVVTPHMIRLNGIVEQARRTKAASQGAA